MQNQQIWRAGMWSRTAKLLPASVVCSYSLLGILEVLSLKAHVLRAWSLSERAVSSPEHSTDQCTAGWASWRKKVTGTVWCSGSLPSSPLVMSSIARPHYVTLCLSSSSKQWSRLTRSQANSSSSGILSK